MIAPFWADSDTQPEDGGFIWYRESNDSIVLSSVTEKIRSSYLGVDSFNPHFLFIATWDHIGYYSGHTDRVRVIKHYNGHLSRSIATDISSQMKLFVYHLYS